MEHFDDIYKKHFKGEKSSVNSSEESQLWNSIVEELGPENSISSASGFIWKPLYGIIIALLILLPIAYFIGQNHGINSSFSETSNQENTKLIQEEINPQNEVDQSEIDVQKELISKPSQNDKSSLEKNYDEIIKKDSPLKVVTSNFTDVGSTSTVTKTSNNFTRKSTQNINPINNQEKVSEKGGTSINNDITTDFAGLNPEDNKDIRSILEESDFDLLNRKSELEKQEAINSFLINSSNIQLFPVSLLMNNPVISEINERQKLISYSVGVISGGNRSGIFYTGTNQGFVDRKNNAERAYFGYNIGLEFTARYKNQWIAKSGLEYTEQRTIYDESFTTLITRDVKGVSGILVNPFSYEVQQETTYDSTATIPSNNRIKQINQFTGIHIPIQIGWQSNMSGLSYGLLVGADIRIRRNQTGKILDMNEEIVDLEKQMNVFYNPVNVGFKANPFIRYALTPRIHIKGAYNVSYFRPVVSTDQSLILGNVSQGFDLGLQYVIR